MTMFIQNDPPLSEVELKSIRIGALRVIRSGMFNNVYVSGNVKKVVFVGRRADDGTPDVVDNAQQLQQGGNDQQPSKGGLSGLSISLFAFLAILVLAVIALLVIRRRKKKIAEAGGIADGRPVKGDAIKEQRTVDGSDGEHSPTASADGNRAVYPLPGSLAEQDELALAASGDYDEVSSLSSASVTPMVRVQPHGRRGQPMTIMEASSSEGINDEGIVFKCCGENDLPVPIPAPQKSSEDLTILDKFDGDVIRCLNTIAEDSDDEHVILDDSDSLMMVDTQEADMHP